MSKSSAQFRLHRLDFKLPRLPFNFLESSAYLCCEPQGKSLLTGGLRIATSACQLMAQKLHSVRNTEAEEEEFISVHPLSSNSSAIICTQLFVSLQTSVYYLLLSSMIVPPRLVSAISA